MRTMTESSAWSSTVALPPEDLRAPSSASALACVTSALRICPPSRPISIRTKSSATRYHLRENTVDGIRMDEHELDPEEPHAWTVDELRPCSLQPIDGCK